MTSKISAYGIDLGTTNSTLTRVLVQSEQSDWPLAQAIEIEQPEHC